VEIDRKQNRAEINPRIALLFLRIRVALGGKKTHVLKKKNNKCVRFQLHLGFSIMASSKKVIATMTINRKYQYGSPNRKYLYLWNYDR